jgi:hypothetical protein
VWLLKRIFGEKMHQFARLSRIFPLLKLPYFGWNPWRIGSSRSPKYSRVLNSFLLFSLTCSQIGLIPLVHAHQCGYITKLKKETTKKTRKPQVLVKDFRKRYYDLQHNSTRRRGGMSVLPEESGLAELNHHVELLCNPHCPQPQQHSCRFLWSTQRPNPRNKNHKI